MEGLRGSGGGGSQVRQELQNRYVDGHMPYLSLLKRPREITVFDAAPKKYLNSGLRKNITKQMKSPETVDLFENGGLGDEDAQAARPFPPYKDSLPVYPAPAYPKGLQRDPTRRNNVH